MTRFEQHQTIERFSSDQTKGFPLSEAVRVGGILYLSGQVGIDDSGRLVSGGVAAETRRTMENIKTILERRGSALEHIVKVTVMLLDMAEWAEMNEVYVAYFHGNLPARSAFAVSGLALGARTEIECWHYSWINLLRRARLNARAAPTQRRTPQQSLRLPRFSPDSPTTAQNRYSALKVVLFEVRYISQDDGRRADIASRGKRVRDCREAPAIDLQVHIRPAPALAVKFLAFNG